MHEGNDEDARIFVSSGGRSRVFLFACMLIGVHAIAAATSQPTGVEYYAREILRALCILPDASRHRFLLYTNHGRRTFHLRCLLGQRPLAAGHAPEVRVLRAPFLWTQGRLSWEMLRRPTDTLFVPAQALPRIVPRRTVVTIHGLEFEHVPQGYGRRHREYLRFVTRDAVRRADALIAVSEATKRALLQQYNADPSIISVIHHGPPSAPQERAGRDEGVSKPFFLYVGRIELKKNVDGIVRAFTLLRGRRPDLPHELLLVGLPGFGYAKIAEEISHSPARAAIRMMGYVPEDTKWALLRDAVALLFPSWAEGFGFPILEGQAAGTPVITSDTTSMPEVAGNGAMFVSPHDDGALADAMAHIIDDAVLRQRLITSGRENLKRFSWERAAHETLRVLVGTAV